MGLKGIRYVLRKTPIHRLKPVPHPVHLLDNQTDLGDLETEDVVCMCVWGV